MAISQLPLGGEAWVTLVVRDGDALQPEGDLELRADDRLLILAEPRHGTDLRATFAGQ